MSGIHGSARLRTMADKIGRALQAHSMEVFPPDAQKELRTFSAREAGEFLDINANTFRHYLKTYADKMPTGTLVNGNRRYFTAEEIQAIRDFLYENGRIGPREYRRRQPGEDVKVFTIFNLKGGVSKTTSTVSIAQMLALRGYRILCVDLDAQASMTNLFGLSPELDPNMPTAYDIISYDDPKPIRQVIRPTYFAGIDIIPASMDIIEFEYETASSFSEGRTAAPFHSRMSAALSQVEDEYDLVIIDTPPQLSFAVISALFASTGMVIPLSASMLDVMSLATFMTMASDLMAVVERQNQEKTFDFIRLLVTKYEASDQPQLQMASFLRTVLGDDVLPAEFVKSTAIGDALNTKQPVLEVGPRDMNKATYDRVIKSISDICNAIEEDLGQAWGRT